MNSIWDILQIKPASDKKEIRRAYAELVKKYHVEEYPEEFAKIQKAYQTAMKLVKEPQMAARTAEGDDVFQEIGKVTSVDETKGEGIVFEEKETILSRLEKVQAEQKTDYSNQEIIDQIIELLKDSIKSSKQKCWEEFFLSDGFLTVHDRTDFIYEMVSAISKDSTLSKTGLEAVFLKELALVYGIISFHDIEYTYDRNKTNKVRIAELLLEQDNSDWLITEQDARLLNRSYSFYFFRRLCEMAQKSGIQDYNQREWGNLAFYAEDEYIPDTPIEEVPKWRDQLELMIEPHGATCVAMHAYLVRHYQIPEQVCHAMRENFEVAGRLGGYPLCSYAPAYEQMCRKYPQMKTSNATELTEWKLKLLLEEPVFEKRRLSAEVRDWLIQLFTFRSCSKELIKNVYAAYESEEKTAQPLLEVLVGRLTEFENLADTRPGKSGYENQMEVSLHNRYFWSYFFSAAYPFSNDGRTPLKQDYHRNLSAYLEKVSPPSVRWKQMFCGKEMKIFHARKEFRLVFAMHHLEYYMEGEPVFYQKLSLKELAALAEDDESMLAFFLLLPITKISSVDEFEEEVLRRIKYLPFYQTVWKYLAAAVARNADWEQQPEHPQKVFEEVYYCENDWHCFRGQLTARKFAVDYKTPDGWYSMKLLHGESRQARGIGEKSERLDYMHGVVKQFLPPEPQLVKMISVAGKTPLEKADAVFEALIERRHLKKGGRGTWTAPPLNEHTKKFLHKWDDRYMGATCASIILWFGKEEEGSIPAVCYMYAEDIWEPVNTLFEVQGEEKNAYIKREERMKRRIGEQVNVVGYFRVEGMLPFPIGIGESGTFYTYFSHQLIGSRSFPELIARCVDFEELDRIEYDRGNRTVGKFVRKLENWYEHRYERETNEVIYNYPYEIYRELFQEL